jgi:hypothetical protein
LAFHKYLKYLAEFLGANILDNKPFIVTPLMDNGNAQIYIQNHPDCDRLTMVRCNLSVHMQKSQIPWTALSHIFGYGVSSLAKYSAWRS